MQDSVSIQSNDSDWFVWMERKQSLFLMAAFIKPYSDLFAQNIGRGFQKQLHIIRGEYSYYIRSRAEHDLMKKVLAGFILDPENRERLQHWSVVGLELNSWADREIETYRDTQTVDLQNTAQYEQFLNNFSSLLFYSCIVPYWMMLAAEEVVATTQNTDEKRWAMSVIELFKPLRGDTRHPQIIDGIVKKYWEHVSSTVKQPIETIRCLLPDELGQALSDTTFIHGIENLSLRNTCVFGILPERTFFFDFSKESIEKLLPKTEVDLDEVSGTVAHPGFVSGTAKIVNVLSDMSKVERGDIIVSINTSPSIMPALKKAVGIVTDEGGITCHAAIVSRELGIPCVIGTTFATKIFKDGDRLELDANKGIVKRAT